MGRSHAGAADRSSATVVPGREDVNAGGEDVDNGAEVGERRLSPALVEGCDGAGCGLRGR